MSPWSYWAYPYKCVLSLTLSVRVTILDVIVNANDILSMCHGVQVRGGKNLVKARYCGVASASALVGRSMETSVAKREISENAALSISKSPSSASA